MVVTSNYFGPRRWRRHVSSKRRTSFNWPHGVLFQKVELFSTYTQTNMALSIIKETWCTYKIYRFEMKKQNKLHGLSPRANYTDRATAACRRSDCQLLRIKGATWSAWRIPWPYSRFSRQEPLLFYQVAPQLYSRGCVPRSRPTTFFFVMPGIETGPPDL
jgi:hypothetical protein